MLNIINDKLYDIADLVNEQKDKLRNRPNFESFEESIALVQECNNYLFVGNPVKLIKLLSYDAYSLFFNSNSDIEVKEATYGDSLKEVVDMGVSQNKSNQNHIYGGLTSFFIDPNIKNFRDLEKNTFYGSLNVTYVDDEIGHYSRRFSFRKERLLITTKINDKVYEEEVILSHTGVLTYYVKCDQICTDRPILVADENNINNALRSYIDENETDEIKFLFPEVFKKEYFKEFNMPQRIK